MYKIPNFLYAKIGQCKLFAQNFTFVIAALYVSGCTALPEKPPTITEIKIPVAVSCIESVPQKPAFKSDVELRALDDYQVTLSLLKDRAERMIYEGELEAVIEGCK